MKLQFNQWFGPEEVILLGGSFICGLVIWWMTFVW